MITLAVDPSIKSAGAAIFEDSSLMHATTIKEPDARRKLPEIERCLWMAQQIANWVLSKGVRPNELAAEWPKIYTPGKGKGNPKGPPGLAGVATAVAAILANTPALRPLNGELSSFSYLPGDWADSVPKATEARKWRSSTRYRRIYSRLNSYERDVWDRDVKGHDAMDAAGIGLFHLGRYTLRRVFPGAT